MTIPDWVLAWGKLYLVVAIILLHHEVVVHRTSKVRAVTISGLWLPFWVWKWFQAFGSFVLQLSRRKKPAKK